MKFVKGTVKELAEEIRCRIDVYGRFHLTVLTVTKIQNPIEEMDENTEVNLGYDLETLYKNASRH